MGVLSLSNKRLLEGDYYPEVKAYYYKKWSGFNMAPHKHGYIEIMYVINGECKVFVDERIIEMKKGDMIIIDGNIIHGLMVDETSTCRMLNVEFIFERGQSAMPSIGNIIKATETLNEFIKSKVSYFLFKDYDEVYGLLKNLVLELDRDNDKYVVESLIYNILIYISRYFVKENKSNVRGGAIYVNKSMGYIERNYDREINVHIIAQHVGIHSGYLHKIFKEYTGKTIIQYITDIRINKSKMLLANTDIPIIEICDYVGVSSRQYFTYMFKKETGVTPLEYRKNAIIDYR